MSMPCRYHVSSRRQINVCRRLSKRLDNARHSFAVGTLLRWYRSGIDPSLRLIHLSTFLGHVNPMSTAWYLTITTELLDAANERFERYVTIPDGVL